MIPAGRRRIGRLLALGGSLLAAVACPLDAAGDSPSSPLPYRRLRDTALGYHGSSDDLATLAEIPLGWFGPTNFDDPLTGDVWWSVGHAVQEANATAAALRIRLVPTWTSDPWGSGVARLTRMIYDEQPIALLGSVDSGSTHLAEQIAAKANLPLVSPLATDPSVTLAGVPWMFSCAPSDAAIAHTLVDALPSPTPDDTGETVPRVAMIAGTDHDSRMTAREVLREFSRRGRSPDFRFDAPPASPNLASVRTSLEAVRPSAILVVANPEDAARWVLALRETGAGPPLVGNDQLAPPDRPLLFGTHVMGHTRFRRLAGRAAEDVRFPILFAPDPTDPVAARFVATFTRDRGHSPDYASALAYDAARLLVDAVRAAGPNRARVREALVRLSPRSGLAGRIEFDGTGQNMRTTLGMGTIRDGQLVRLSNPHSATQSAASP